VEAGREPDFTRGEESRCEGGGVNGGKRPQTGDTKRRIDADLRGRCWERKWGDGRRFATAFPNTRGRGKTVSRFESYARVESRGMFLRCL